MPVCFGASKWTSIHAFTVGCSAILMNLLINRTLINDPQWALHSQMSSAERLALCGIASRRKPDLALEIGTYQGGSLQMLVQHAKRVISVDIDKTVGEKLAGSFSNVEFIAGDSVTTLPEVVRDLNKRRERVGLVLVDGDHSRVGVKRDLLNVLKLDVQEPMALLMHDTFNPDVRLGILDVDWGSYPHVHEVDLDLCGGMCFQEAFDTAAKGSMWGGLGCALLLPESRVGKLRIQRNQQPAFDALLPKSVHIPAPLWQRIGRRLRGAVRVLLGATRF